MKANIFVLVLSFLLFAAGLYTARAQQFGNGFDCQGPTLGCNSLFCQSEGGVCYNGDDELVSYNFWTGTPDAYYNWCIALVGSCCPQPSELQICSETFYDLPLLQTYCASTYEVCTGTVSTLNCSLSGPPCN
jgi:hypothetical protein